SRAMTFTGQLAVIEGGLRVGTFNNVSTNGPLGNANNTKPIILGNATDVLGNVSNRLGYIRYASSGAVNGATDKPFTLTTGGRGGFWVNDDSAISLTLNGKISGGGTLVKMGASDNGDATTLVLSSSSNDWSGGTLVTDGFVSIPTGN